MAWEKMKVYTCDVCRKQVHSWADFALPVGWVGSRHKKGYCICSDCHLAHVRMRRVIENEIENERKESE